jgi:hypothetical protein
MKQCPLFFEKSKYAYPRRRKVCHNAATVLTCLPQSNEGTYTTVVFAKICTTHAGILNAFKKDTAKTILAVYSAQTN